jgi:hypothetical protein
MPAVSTSVEPLRSAATRLLRHVCPIWFRRRRVRPASASTAPCAASAQAACRFGALPGRERLEQRHFGE